MKLAIHNGSRVWGGNEKWVAMLSAGLITRGHVVAAACPHGPLRRALEGIGVATTSARPRGDASLLATLRFAWWLQRERPDALLLTSWRTTPWAAWAARMAGVPRVVARLGIARPVLPRGRITRAFRRRVDAVIVNAPDVRDTFAASAPWFRGDAIHVILNGVHPPAVGHGTLRERLRRELRASPGDLLVGGAGNLSARKGFDLLLRAFAASLGRDGPSEPDDRAADGTAALAPSSDPAEPDDRTAASVAAPAPSSDPAEPDDRNAASVAAPAPSSEPVEPDDRAGAGPDAQTPRPTTSPGTGEVASLSEPERAHLVIVGGGEALGELRALAERLGIAWRVHFLGHRADAADVIGGLDLFVLPSRNEGMANVMLEAMSAGVPVIASNVSGVRAALGPEDGGPPAGWIVPPDDEAALADALREVAAGLAMADSDDDQASADWSSDAAAGTSGDDDVARRVAEASRRVRERFGVERMVMECERVLFPSFLGTGD